MSLSSSKRSSYPSRVQKILRRLQQSYGDEAVNLALQALEVLTPIPLASEPPVLAQETETLLRSAYDTCRQQAGTEWVHQAMFYVNYPTSEGRRLVPNPKIETMRRLTATHQHRIY